MHCLTSVGFYKNTIIYENRGGDHGQTSQLHEKNKDSIDTHNRKRFIIIGNDRFRLTDIHSYGIKYGVSYLVKNSNQVQVGQSAFESLSYYDLESQEEPMYDINGNPVIINGNIVRMGSLSEKDFFIEESRILYINNHEYYEKLVDFNIDNKLAELDAQLI